MNPFQFKSSIFSRFRSFPMLHRFHPLSRPLVRVECLLLRCINIVCWRTKNVYYPLHPYPLSFPVTGMETGFHIMGNSENIGSNIIFSSELHAMAKRLHKRKSEVEWGWGRKKTAKRPITQHGIIIRNAAGAPPMREGVKNPKPEHQQYTEKRPRRRRKLFVGEFCYSHYSIPLLYFFFLCCLGDCRK